jgi:hypothetical protein
MTEYNYSSGGGKTSKEVHYLNKKDRIYGKVTSSVTPLINKTNKLASLESFYNINKSNEIKPLSNLLQQSRHSGAILRAQ